MKIIVPSVNLRKGALPPPVSDNLIDYLEWVCISVERHSRQSIFAYGLMAHWVKFAHFSEKQIETATDLVNNVKSQYDVGGRA